MFNKMRSQYLRYIISFSVFCIYCFFFLSYIGASSNGEQQLLVNLEINDVKFSGVLTALEAETSTKTVPTNNGINHQHVSNSNADKIIAHCHDDSDSHDKTSSSNNNDNIKDLTIAQERAEEESDAETLSNKSPTGNLNSAANANDSNSSKNSLRIS